MTITFGKSLDYVRVAYLIHIFAAIVVLNSSLPMLVTLPLLSILLASIILTTRQNRPLPSFTKLSRHGTYWLLHRCSGEETRYDHMRISFDGGLFIILTLTADNSSFEVRRPAACPRDPEIDRNGSRGQAAGRRDLNCQQTLVVFKDQLTSEQYRAFNVIGKINTKSTNT